MRAAIGLIGFGRMGSAICARLIEAGYELAVADRDPALESPVRALGAEWLGTDAAAVPTKTTLLLTILPSTAELQNVLGALLPAMTRHHTWIDMTSCAPSAGLALQQRARERGVACLEATLGGGAEAARSSVLQLFVGGEADVLERHRPVLEALGSVEHVGPAGAGYLVKLLVNLLWFGQAIAVGEALLLAQRAGLEPERLQGTLARSAAASQFIERDLSALLDGDYLANFGLDRCCEELDAIVEQAEQERLPFTLSTRVREIYRLALERFGAADGELLAVALLEEQAGTQLRRVTGRS